MVAVVGEWLKSKVEGLPKGPDDGQAQARTIAELVTQQRDQGSEIGALRTNMEREFAGMQRILDERCPKGALTKLQREVGELRGEARGRTVFWSCVAGALGAVASACVMACVHWSDRAEVATREANVSQREATVARLEAERSRDQVRIMQASTPEPRPQQPVVVDPVPNGPMLLPKP